jgi:hypothetical protein
MRRVGDAQGEGLGLQRVQTLPANAIALLRKATRRRWVP